MIKISFIFILSTLFIVQDEYILVKLAEKGKKNLDNNLIMLVCAVLKYAIL